MKIKISLLIIILSGLVLFTCCSSQPVDHASVKDEPFSSEIEKQYELAQNLFSQKTYQQAAVILEKILSDAKNRSQKEKIMFLFAESYFYLHWNEEADNLYNQYLTIFPETKYFDEVLTHRYEIAFRFINGEKQELLGLAILSATDKGIQLARDLIKQFPYAPITETYHLKLADYFYKHENYDEAMLEYDLFIQVHPQSNAIPLAQFRSAESYLPDYKGAEYDVTVLDKARRLFNVFLEKYPSDELIPEVKNRLAQIISLKAQRDFIIGDYYLRTGEKPAARVYFESVINNYPETQWAQKAREAMATIKE